MHATEFLRQSSPTIAPFVVLCGGERHLKEAAVHIVRREVLGEGEEQNVALSEHGGKTAEWKTIHDELSMISMFGDRRLIVIDDADEFVTKNRPSLESYAAAPSARSVLVLSVKTWKTNTKLAKALASSGLVLECTPLAGGQLVRWLTSTAEEQFGKQLTRDAAALMVELVGDSLGLLERELAKLSAYVGNEPRISVDSVRTIVGGWRAETTWKMTDAIRNGDAATALAALGKLLADGEAPLRLLGGLNFVYRKYANATELARRGKPLRNALKESGVFPRDLDAAERYLRRIGRPRAEELFALLLRADGQLKGASRLPDRLQLEELVLRLTGVAFAVADTVSL